MSCVNGCHRVIEYEVIYEPNHKELLCINCAWFHASKGSSGRLVRTEVEESE